MRALFLLCVPWMLSATVHAEEADLVLRNGKIVTMDQKYGTAQALAVKGDRILAVGTEDDIARLIGKKTKVIDLKGRLAIPGLIESHAHFVSLGESKMMLDLRTAKTWQDIVQQVKQAAKSTPKGEWIIGRGWHQEKWKTKPTSNVEGYPTHFALSKLTPHHPVLLTHASGHLCFANAYAMRLAGVTAKTVSPSGGEILKDKQSRPTGIFRETAQGKVQRAHRLSLQRRTPAQKKRHLLKAIELANQECIAHGITSFQDAGTSFETIETFKELAKKGMLKTRLWVMIRANHLQLEKKLTRRHILNVGKGFLTVRAIKLIFDGALGAHGAWLLQPYEDLPGKSGLNTLPLTLFRKTAEIAIKNDYQLCVHAIGDRANREALDVFEQMFKKHPSKASRRWRIEHAQHLHPDDIPRFAKLKVIASMQGIHCTSDAVFVLKRLGFRRASQGAYVWQSLLKSGAIIANGTDAPVESIDPLACFYASVTRKLKSGVAFFPEQKMTRMQALRSYTLDAAYAAFEEKVKGSLTPGRYADVVVLSHDILKVPDKELPKAKVIQTIVAGKVVYRSMK